jgi:VWFA-related protein
MMRDPSRFPRRLAAAFAAVLGTAALAQTPAPTPSRGFVKSVDVSVTNIDVVVTDSKGNRITGLKKEDFEIVEDGLQQQITNFYAVEQGRTVMVGDEEIPPQPAPPAPAPGVPAPPAPPPLYPAPKTRIVIFVDNLHLQPFNRNRILKNVEDFIKDRIKGDVEGMVITFNRSMKVRRKFTNDGRDLVDVLKQIEGESALFTTYYSERRDVIQAIDDAQSPEAAQQRVRSFIQSHDNDMSFTMDALKQTVNQLAGVEGRKILVHVSEGLPQSVGMELWSYIQDKFKSGSTGLSQFEFDKTTSYVSLYMIDAAGLTVDSSVTAESRTMSARLDPFIERTNLQAMIQMMAEDTGGMAIMNKNDITLSLRQMEQDYTSYYSLGYRSLRSGSDRPHKLNVTVKKKGLTARARKSYLEKSPETKAMEGVISALVFPRDDNPLAVGVETGKPVPADRQNYFVPVRLRVPYSRIAMLPEGNKVRGRLFLYFIVIDSSGQQSELSTQSVPIEVDAKVFDGLSKKDFVYDVKMLMIPGGQKLSVAVRDEVTNQTSFIQKSIFVSAFSGEEAPPKK